MSKVSKSRFLSGIVAGGENRTTIFGGFTTKHRDYTPKEIAAAHDRNENFHGKQANMDKIRLYQTIKHDLTEFVKNCEDAEQIDGFGPNIHEKHAILWLDFSPAAILSAEETAALAAIMTKVDGTVISAVDGHVRITFDIKNIWGD